MACFVYVRTDRRDASAASTLTVPYHFEINCDLDVITNEEPTEFALAALVNPLVFWLFEGSVVDEAVP